MVSFLQFSAQNFVYTFPLPIDATCTAHPFLLDLTTRIIFGEEYKSLNSILYSFLHSLLTAFLLGPTLLSTLFSKSLSLRSSLNLSDQVSHQCKTKDKIMVLPFNLNIFNSKLEDKRFFTEWYQVFPYFNLLLTSSWIEFWFFMFVPKCLNYSTLSKRLIIIFLIVTTSCFLISRHDHIHSFVSFSSKTISLLATKYLIT